MGLAAAADAGQDRETPEATAPKATTLASTRVSNSNLVSPPLPTPPNGAGSLSGSGAAGTPVASLADVKRIYVAALTGGRGADTLRDLIIASVSASHEFLITENEERADAVLKGAAQDDIFTDHFSANDSTSVHGSMGIYGAAVKGSTRSPGGYATESAGERESTRDEERKHEAYAAVRLCNKDGDVIWSTTQESLGAKFRGAGADVAARVARQLASDLQKARRQEFETAVPAGSGSLPPAGPLGPPMSINPSTPRVVPPARTKQ